MSFSRRSVLMLVAGAILCLSVMAGSVLFLPRAQAADVLQAVDPGPVTPPSPLPTISPSVTVLTSSTHPSETAWYRSRSVGLHWEGSPVNHLVLQGWDSPAWIKDVAIVGDVAYVAAAQSGFPPPQYQGLVLLDVSDPTSPAVLGTYTGAGDFPAGAIVTIERVAVQGDYAYCAARYVADFEHKWFLAIIDVSSPAAPALVGFRPLILHEWGALLVRDGYVYVTSDLLVGPRNTDWEHWLDIVDVSDPANPVYAGGCQLPDSVMFVQSREMAFKDDFLYIPTGPSLGQKLTEVDATDPTSPTVVTTLADDCVQPCIDGSLLFAFNQDTSQGAVNVFDIADPQAAHLEGEMLTFHSWVQGGSNAVQCLVESDQSLSRRYLFGGLKLTDPGMVFSNAYFTEIFDATQPLPLEPPNKSRVVGGVGPETTLPGDCAECLSFANSSLFMGYDGEGLWISHIGPDAYSYVLDQSPSTVPNMTPVGTQSGLGADLSVTAPADGVYYFHVRAKDNAGTWSPTLTRKVQIDTAVPTITSNADGQAHQSFTLVFTGSDPGGSGVAHTFCRPVIPGVSTGYVEKSSVTLRIRIRHKRPGLARGTYAFQYYCTDAAGNRSTTGSCQVIIG